MSKNIVFCADGTWNSPHAADSDDDDSGPSNVFKLFLRLKGEDDDNTTLLAKEQERVLKDNQGKVVQVAKYLHGVGDSNNFLARVLGGSVGTGLIARVVRGYTFVSRCYEPGDRIYLVGFSRGAYTARALAALISAKGLLPQAIAADRQEAYRKGSAVWYDWREDVLRSKGLTLRNLQEAIRDLPNFLGEDGPPKIAMVPAPIEAIAVWDTVGALGIPIYDRKGSTLDAFQFADTKLSDNVKFGRHAISIDEERENFTPTLWDPDDNKNRIIQVLFCGGHADVGGGNPSAESGLSDCALQWVVRELRALGVELTPLTLPRTRDPLAIGHAEWLKFGWNFLPTGPRRLLAAPGLQLSEAVVLRTGAAGVLANGEADTRRAPYAPTNIPSYLAGSIAAAGVKVVKLDDPND